MKLQLSTISLVLLFLLSLTVSAQQPTATPPIDDNDTVKISTTLIQADVTVTDKDGKVVTDLKPEDFEVYENGKKQTITNFSFISVVKPAENVTPQKVKTDKNTIPIPPVKLKTEQVRRTYALVVDDLGLSFESIREVQQSIKNFINKQMQEGDLVAIIRTGSGIGAMQSFTSDKRQLLAAVDKIRWNSQGRSGISPIPPITQGGVKEILNGQTDSSGNEKKIAGTEEDKEFLEQVNENRNENFSIGTLGSLRYIIGGMRELPGRKALMLFSEGFSLTSTAANTRTPKQNRILDEMRFLADLANRSSVIIYTLDPRGIRETVSLTAEDNTWDYRTGVFGSNSDALSQTLEGRNNTFRETQESLRYLAYETGGIPYLNQNFVDVGLKEAVADQSSYYLLGYQPNDETFDPKKAKFNKLEIKVTRPGLKIRYRSGFYGISDEKLQDVSKTPQQKLVAALTSPFGANDVNLTLYPVFQNDAQSGDIIQALVYIDAKDLNFATANEKRKTNFDLIAMTFGDNGIQIDQLSKNYTIEVSEKVYQNMIANGFVYTLTVPIKKSGAYQFRIALRDTVSNKVGSASQFIEVPNIKKQMVLSNLVLDNFTVSEWQKIKLGGNRDESERSVLLDATVRKFKRGTILRYDYVIYNPKQSRQIETRLRLIKDGKVVYEENPISVNTNGETDLQRIQTANAISIGKNLEIGNYVLQVIATDKANIKKFATQYVEFEIVE